MKNTLILEMINNNQIEELKKAIMEEIYNENIKKDAGMKNRYLAMKRYFKYGITDDRPARNKPCKDIEVDGKIYNSFLDGYSIALTTEDIGEIESFDKTAAKYMDVKKFFDIPKAVKEKINIVNVIAKAKSQGYKMKKSEFDIMSYKYLFKYKSTYYRMGLLEKVYNIIDDGKEATVYYQGEKSPFIIKTSIGMCLISPMNIQAEPTVDKVIIEV